MFIKIHLFLLTKKAFKLVAKFTTMYLNVYLMVIFQYTVTRLSPNNVNKIVVKNAVTNVLTFSKEIEINFSIENHN